MWRPTLLGAITGWMVLVLLLFSGVSRGLIEAGLLEATCRRDDWDCIGPAPLLLGAYSIPDAFVFLLLLPFTFETLKDPLGLLSRFILFGALIVYAIVAVALNYWIWRLRSALTSRQQP